MEILEAWVNTQRYLAVTKQYVLRASCLLVLQCLHRLLVFWTGKCFPHSRSRTSSGTPLTPGFFCEKLWSAPPFYIAADCEPPNESKPERQLVTLTTIVAVLHYKTVHNGKVKEKVKQAVPPFELAPSNCISLSSLVETIYSSHYWIVLCNWGGERNNRWYRLCSFVSPK